MVLTVARQSSPEVGSVLLSCSRAIKLVRGSGCQNFAYEALQNQNEKRARGEVINTNIYGMSLVRAEY